VFANLNQQAKQAKEITNRGIRKLQPGNSTDEVFSFVSASMDENFG
jgi:hypothetical protein